MFGVVRGVSRSAFLILVFASLGWTQAVQACSLSFTAPVRGSTVSTATIGVSGVGSGNANPNDVGTVTATLNGATFFTQTGTFTVLINFFGSGGASVTLQPGPNFFNVTGSVNGCSASDSMVVYYTPPPPQAQKNNGPPSCPSNGSNPINGATGNKFQVETDYAGSPVRLPLGVTRYYNSAYGNARELGWNWRSSYDRQLSVSGTAAYIARPDGAAYKFTQTGANWLPDGDVDDKLLPITGGWQFIRGEDNASEYYDAAGRLTSIVTTEGFAQDLAYDANGRLFSVTERLSARQLLFSYDAQSRISTITDPATGVTTYGYDANNNLATVTYPDGDANPANNPVRSYVYNEAANTSNANLPHALTGIVDENGNRYATYRYDATGRGISSEHAGGADKVTFAYNANGTTTVTDSAGTAGTGTPRTYSYQNVLGVLKTTGVSGGACNACAGTATAFIYDANGNVASQTDFNGNLSCYAYDLTRNLETVRVDGIAPGGSCPVNLSTYVPAANTVERKIVTAWHATYRLPTQIDEPGRRTTFAYFPNGTVQTQTVTDTALNRSQAWNYTYDANGQLKTVDGPRLPADVADVTTYDYYASAGANNAVGDLWKVTNALGHITTFTLYDPHGRPISLTDPNGLVVGLSYDAQGRLKTRTVGGATTTFDYYPNSQLKTLTLADLSRYTYTYDAAHRLTQIVDNLGNEVDDIPDKMGNAVQRVSKNPDGTTAKTQSAVFNVLNQLQLSLGAQNQTSQFTYDNNGNPKTTIDPKNHPATVYVYDALNRLKQVQDAATGTTLYVRNGLDQLTNVIAPNGATTTYTVDALDNRLTEASSDRGTLIATYDEAGNRKTLSNARGITATYAYDALNRLISVSYPAAGENLTFTYDTGTGCTHGLGRLCQVTDSAGTTVFAYDNQGNLTQQVRTEAGQSYTTGYSYNSVNRMTGITLPGNRTVTYSRDPIGRIGGVSAPVNGTLTSLVSQIGYNALGLVTQQTFANGYQDSRGYNTDGQAISTAQTTATGGGATQVPLPMWAVTLLALGIGLIGARFGKGHGKHLAIIVLFAAGTLLSGLLYSAAAYAPITLHYDANGNLDQRIDGLGTTTYTHDALDRLDSEAGPSKTQSFGYDGNGNRTGDGSASYTHTVNTNRLATKNGAAIATDPAGNITGDGTYTYVYNQANQLSQVKLGTTVVAGYKYDYQGRRTEKTLGATATIYHYDQASHLIAESSNTGAIQRSYIWRDDTPIVQIDQSGADQPLYLETDTLATPRTARNQAGTIVWQWYSDGFGSTAALEDPDGNGQATKINLRFPGQYYDAETGLHYNMARYYNPAVGRYLQSDPIGLSGGINTFTYVENGPLSFADPAGLTPQTDVVKWVLKKVWDGCKWVWKRFKSNADEASGGKNGLPKNPNDLFKQGYKETSHPDAAKAGHRSFEDPATGDKLRFDQGKPGQPGYEGQDHYHRYNPEGTGKQDMYLDKNGNPCPRGCDDSHLFPGE